MAADRVTLFLCGDVMTGRGVDQILAHPGDPRLAEPWSGDARSYVKLAEAANGPIPRPVHPGWLWGDALEVLEREAPDARLINLETAITADGEFAPGKGIHYRMHPDNTDCLAVARPDVCVLANNHVLDFGRQGLSDTLAALARAGLPVAGAGLDEERARRPAVLAHPGGGRVIVFACGTASSGIPPEWAAGPGRPGVDYLPDLSATTANALTARVRAVRRPGDVVVVSLHWGPNWGYRVGPDEARFARALADGGADIVYGHSSHHPRPVEVHHGRLILYGCGDFIDDYEGISGYEEYRDDLRLAYFATVEPATGTLVSLRMVPLQARRMRLHHATAADAAWLSGVLDRVSRRYGSRVDLAPDGTLALRPDGTLALRPDGTIQLSVRIRRAVAVSGIRHPRRATCPRPGKAGDVERVVLHVDLDQFIVAVELLRRPWLRGRPVLVGGTGDPARRGVVAGASYEARARGVVSGTPLRTAASRCPEAVFLPLDRDAYLAASGRFLAVLAETAASLGAAPGSTPGTPGAAATGPGAAAGAPGTPGTAPAVLEAAGWDEAFLLVVTADAGQAARRVQAAVRAATGLDCSVGIGDNKLRAKLASGLAKPAGVFRLDASNWRAVMADRPPQALWGIGRATAARLAGLGVRTVGELATADEGLLAAEFGPHAGPWLGMLARGDDTSPVRERPPQARSHGREVTFQRDVTDPAVLREQVRRLAGQVCRELAERGVPARRVVVKVRWAPFDTHTHGVRLAEPTRDAAAIEAAALAALHALRQPRPVRLVGVRAEVGEGPAPAPRG